MKFAAVCYLLARCASTSAFAPPTSVVKSDASFLASTALHMAPPPRTPFVTKEGLFLGEGVWNAATKTVGSEETGEYLKASELKHGRSAMLAVLGFSFQKFGITFDKISPHEYLSISQSVKFADLAALGPLDAIKAVPAEGLTQIFCAVALVELYELTHKNLTFTSGESVAPGLQAGGLTGDLGFNPLKFIVTDKLKMNELQNGRAAMVAISAWVAHDLIPGSVPIPLLWA